MAPGEVASASGEPDASDARPDPATADSADGFGAGAAAGVALTDGDQPGAVRAEDVTAHTSPSRLDAAGVPESASPGEAPRATTADEPDDDGARVQGVLASDADPGEGDEAGDAGTGSPSAPPDAAGASSADAEPPEEPAGGAAVAGSVSVDRGSPAAEGEAAAPALSSGAPAPTEPAPSSDAPTSAPVGGTFARGGEEAAIWRSVMAARNAEAAHGVQSGRAAVADEGGSAEDSTVRGAVARENADTDGGDGRAAARRVAATADEPVDEGESESADADRRENTTAHEDGGN